MGTDNFVSRFNLSDFIKQNINHWDCTKFLVIENNVAVNIDYDEMHKDAKWDGLKYYVTNTGLPTTEVIAQYHDLWIIECAFRISKEAFLISHVTGWCIRAHICICFMAYKVYKEQQCLLSTLGINLSVDKVLEISKMISSVTI